MSWCYPGKSLENTAGYKQTTLHIISIYWKEHTHTHTHLYFWRPALTWTQFLKGHITPKLKKYKFLFSPVVPFFNWDSFGVSCWADEISDIAVSETRQHSPILLWPVSCRNCFLFRESRLLTVWLIIRQNASLTSSTTELTLSNHPSPHPWADLCFQQDWTC